MLSRKEQNEMGLPFPDEWRERIEKTLYKVYQERCDQKNKSFQVHALSYPDELFLAVGLVDNKNEQEMPVSFIVSMDLDKSDKDYEKKVDTLIDSMGVFFDSYFEESDWDDYVARWTEASFRDLDFFYKVSRENVALSIQAEILLRSH